MSATLVRTLVLGALLSLVFPPGWCCAALGAEVPAPVQEKHQGKCCCHHTTPKKPPAPQPYPAPPPCCCRRETPAPPERVLPDDFAGLTAPVAPAPGAAPAPPCHPLPMEADPPALAPPLHVLHCLWLC